MGSQTVEVAGLEFKVSPDFWLRRITHFPFYFETTNPSFRVDVKRAADDTPYEALPVDGLVFEIVFADGTMIRRNLDIPYLEKEQSTRLLLKNIFTAHPGQTIIRLPFDFVAQRQWETLYSYHVRHGEQLWTACIGPMYGVIAGALLGVLSQRIFG